MADRDPITLVHEAIVGALTPALGPRWTIETIPWPLTVDELRQLLQRTPVAAIAFGEFDPDAAARRLAGEVAFRILVGVKSAKRPARFLGETTSPGLYRGLMATAKAVHGLTVPGLGTLQVGRIVPSYSDAFSALDLALGVVPVTCRVVVGDVLGWADEMDDLDAIATTWPDAPEAPTDIINLPAPPAETGGA